MLISLFLKVMLLLINFEQLFKKGKSTSFQKPFLKLREGKGPGTGWLLLQFHWSITSQSKFTQNHGNILIFP